MIEQLEQLHVTSFCSVQVEDSFQIDQLLGSDTMDSLQPTWLDVSTHITSYHHESPSFVVRTGTLALERNLLRNCCTVVVYESSLCWIFVC